MKTKELFKKSIEEAKSLPKGLWIAALIIPGGLVTIAAYLAGKEIFDKMLKKEKKNEQNSNKN